MSSGTILRHCTVAILAAAGLALAVPGCARRPPQPPAQVKTSLEEFNDVIRRSIRNPVRAAQLQRLGTQAYRLSSELNWLSREYQNQMEQLTADYDTKPADFRNLISDFKLQRDRLRSEIVALFFRMRDLTNASEWKELAEHERKLLTLVLRGENTG
jgi:hypothetical protein